jgi:glycerol kinase
MTLILAVDQGTTSCRAMLFELGSGEPAIRSVAQAEFSQIFPRPGWVEHDPREIWATQHGVMTECLSRANARAADVAAIGITNQRETAVLWDRESGRPVCNAIVWQDRRTAQRCDELRKSGKADLIRERTGLEIDAYFSATKLAWMLEHVEGAREAAEAGRLAFGTIDSWLIWNLTRGVTHAIDASNASRTMLCDIRTGAWDDDLLDLFGIPRSVLPEIVPSTGIVAETAAGVFESRLPIAGIAGDQQAALFGQGCLAPGQAKNTYGTGCFMLMQTGTTPVTSVNRLLTTVAWKRGDELSYALEGAVFIAGAAVQWLRDGLGIIRNASEIEPLARSVESSEGVSFVPAFAGLGTPYWDPHARGTITGLTRGSSAGHLARATLEGIALQVADVADAMSRDAGRAMTALRVDGGATANGLLMQIQADVLGIPVIRPRVLETTALGAARLAAVGVGARSMDDIAADADGGRPGENVFEPSMSDSERSALRDQWADAVQRARGNLEPRPAP